MRGSLLRRPPREVFKTGWGDFLIPRRDGPLGESLWGPLHVGGFLDFVFFGFSTVEQGEGTYGRPSP